MLYFCEACKDTREYASFCFILPCERCKDRVRPTMAGSLQELLNSPSYLHAWQPIPPHRVMIHPGWHFLATSKLEVPPYEVDSAAPVDLWSIWMHTKDPKVNTTNTVFGTPGGSITVFAGRNPDGDWTSAQVHLSTCMEQAEAAAVFAQRVFVTTTIPVALSFVG